MAKAKPKAKPPVKERPKEQPKGEEVTFDSISDKKGPYFGRKMLNSRPQTPKTTPFRNNFQLIFTQII